MFFGELENVPDIIAKPPTTQRLSDLKRAAPLARPVETVRRWRVRKPARPLSRAFFLHSVVLTAMIDR